MTIKVLRPAQVTGMSAWVQISENDEVIQMPLQEQGLPMLSKYRLSGCQSKSKLGKSER